MSAAARPGGAPERAALFAVLRSAEFARAYTFTVLGAMLGTHLIERTMGQVVLRTIIAGLCVTGIAVLVARREEISFFRLVPTSLVLLTGWAFATIFWSSDPAISFGRWLALAAVAVLAVTIGHVRDTLQTVRAFADVARVALALSLGLEIFSGVLIDTPLRFLGIQGNIAQWGPVQGIFGTRNMLGIVAVLALITFVVEWRTHSVRPALSYASIGLGVVLALLSASPTVFILAAAVGAATAALALVRAVPARSRVAVQWGLGGAVATAGVALWVQRSRILDLLGATDDLAMRNSLWTLANFYVRMRPVQGWGFFGPWELSEQPFATINMLLRQRHTTALNAFVDVLVQLGWVGIVLFCALAGVALVRSWLDASERKSIVYAWTPLMLVALGVTSLFESVALYGTGWLLLVICAVRAGQSRSWRERLDAIGVRRPPPEPSDALG
ncbi:O-antigen ligase family protein [Microbacterium sp. W1N]|uniref:O-antigen ligase family protein n=1 Tax=Microbacterium festucae TaxID=2977531 RepID=UPI0021C250DF|nr:O-antigen ligase family protein [Microbacterium festucae]MCT9818748.1 O-antigen ligase family protein [Microbacterium festucae]